MENVLSNNNFKITQNMYIFFFYDINVFNSNILFIISLSTSIYNNKVRSVRRKFRDQ